MLKRWMPCLAALVLLQGGVHPAQSKTMSEEFEGLSKEQLDELVEFVVGNSIFFLFHEAGHMLVSELDLPVLGKEEDAVDTLSSLLMLEAKSDTLDKALTDSADAWLMSGKASEAAGEAPVFWDAHGLDKQRAFSMVCMMIGQDAEGFKEFADSVDFPDSRREQCAGEYDHARKSWFGVLAPHEIPGDEQVKFTITYEDTDDENLKEYAEFVRDTDLMSIIRDTFSNLYKMDDGIKLTAKACGEANAYWSPQEREMTFCYELAQYNTALIADYLKNKQNQ